MKVKAQREIQQVHQISSIKKSKAEASNTWEMSAQDALRVDYLTHCSSSNLKCS